LDAELIYFNDHYDMALLCVHLDYPLEYPSIGCGPEYGQDVFVLARDGEVSLGVRCGNIKWQEEPGLLGRDYHMFLSCDLPEVICIIFLCCMLYLIGVYLIVYLILQYFFDAGWQWRNGD
jgi:hypothetical protein